MNLTVYSAFAQADMYYVVASESMPYTKSDLHSPESNSLNEENGVLIGGVNGLA